MFLKNKKLIFVSGDKSKDVVYFLEFVLKKDFSVFSTENIPGIIDIFSVIRSDVLIIKDNNENYEKIKEFLDRFSSSIFIATETEKKGKIKKILQGSFKELSFIIDLSVAKKTEIAKKKNILTFGVNKKSADFYITDIHQKEEETNFKVNYDSNIIPFWFQKRLKNKEIYSFLPALCVAKVLGLNLAQVSFEIKKDLEFLFTED